jgi:hypothetical protein
MAATIPAVFMAAAQIVNEIRSAPAPIDIEARKKIKLALGYFVWLLAYLFLILLFGFGAATALVTFTFLYFWVKTGWLYSLIYTAAVVGVAQLMGKLLGLYWPSGLLSSL